MTLLHIDGFDDGLSSSKWTTFAGTVATAYGRNGSGIRLANSSQILTRTLPAADEHATLIWGAAVRPSSANVIMLQMESDAGATDHLTFFINNALLIEARRGGSGGVLLGTASTALNANTWAYVECKATLSDTVGTVDVRINGASVLSLTGQDTKNGGTKTVFDRVAVFGGITDFDDLYLCNGAGTVNTGFVGDCTISNLLPTAAGNSSQLLGSDGDRVDNHLLVDEAAPNDTDYVGSATAGEKDTYVVGDLPAGSTVVGVVARMWAATSDAGAKSLRAVTRIGTTDYAGDTKALTSTFGHFEQRSATSPATSAAWTEAEVNGAQFGAEVQA